MKIPVLMAVAVMMGCATATMYPDGVREMSAGTHAWVIHAKVNKRAGEGSAGAFVLRRADELCPGGYDIVETPQGDGRSTVTVTITKRTRPLLEAIITVRCR